MVKTNKKNKFYHVTVDRTVKEKTSDPIYKAYYKLGEQIIIQAIKDMIKVRKHPATNANLNTELKCFFKNKDYVDLLLGCDSYYIYKKYNINLEGGCI